jgi:hypothetical protein
MHVATSIVATFPHIPAALLAHCHCPSRDFLLLLPLVLAGCSGSGGRILFTYSCSHCPSRINAR